MEFWKNIFSKIQFVFNQEKKQIGIYKYIDSGFNFGIFLIFVFAVIIIVLSFIIYNRTRKTKGFILKKAEELTEDDLNFEEDKKAQKLLG